MTLLWNAKGPQTSNWTQKRVEEDLCAKFVMHSASGIAQNRNLGGFQYTVDEQQPAV